jgi:hypothetical protein
LELAAVIISAFAASATVVAVYFAWRTVAESAVARRQNERARKRERLQQLEGLLEELFFNFDYKGQAIYTPDELRWFLLRNQVAHMLIGIEDDLPECRRVPEATSAANALNSFHRVEIENALKKLTDEDEADVVPKYPWQRKQRTG